MSDAAVADVLTASPLIGGPTSVEAYPVVKDVALRYSDLGPDGRVGTIGLARWFEDARVQADLSGVRKHLEAADLGQVRMLLATQRVEWLAEMPFRQQYRLGIGLRRVGGSSFTYGYGVFAGERCVAVGDSVAVLVVDGAPTRLPDAAREALESMAVDEPGAVAQTTPGESRRSPSAYPFGLDLRARVGDIDTNRHVNNVVLVGWYAEAVAAWQMDLLGESAGGPPPELAPRSWAVQYLAEVVYPATYGLAVEATVDEDAGSVRYACGLFLGDRCVGLADGIGPLDRSLGAVPRRR